MLQTSGNYTISGPGFHRKTVIFDRCFETACADRMSGGSLKIEVVLWTAFDATYYTGGQAYVSGLPSGRQLASSRVGVTLALPLARHHSLKLAYSIGATTPVGTDFRVFAISYQYLWFDKH
jgi:hypothetical protein